jgi:UDP-N-acetylglucosamine 2-epimerase (non-hydrolysing)
VIAVERPDVVLVQGDTTTTFCGALAAFYGRIAVGHIEAGLRTGDIYRPFPEEMNRRLTGRIADLHFAPTAAAAENLRREGVDAGAIVVTGNTGVDAVIHVLRRLDSGELVGFTGFDTDASKKQILVTAHRRESFGRGLDAICAALAQLARRADVEIVYPIHPNPEVDRTVKRRLAHLTNIRLLPPVPYVPFVDLMRRSHIILTDSGGIQEEAPSLGVPVLVLREKTERLEGVSAGTARVVGIDAQRIARDVELLLDDAKAHRAMTCRHNAYGDGHASDVIASFLTERLRPALQLGQLG